MFFLNIGSGCCTYYKMKLKRKIDLSICQNRLSELLVNREIVKKVSRYVMATRLHHFGTILENSLWTTMLKHHTYWWRPKKVKKKKKILLGIFYLKKHQSFQYVVDTPRHFHFSSMDEARLSVPFSNWPIHWQAVQLSSEEKVQFISQKNSIY